MMDEHDPPEEPTSTDYEVGYPKPPKHSPFRCCPSGNPRGRPKGTKNLKAGRMEEHREKIVVRERTRSQSVSNPPATPG